MIYYKLCEAMQHNNMNSRRVRKIPVDPESIRYASTGCSHVYLRGVKKGERCTGKASKGLSWCCKHKPKVSAPVTDNDLEKLCDDMMKLADTPMTDADAVDGLSGVMSSMIFPEDSGEANILEADVEGRVEESGRMLVVKNTVQVPNYTSTPNGADNTRVIVMVRDGNSGGGGVSEELIQGQWINADGDETPRDLANIEVNENVIERSEESEPVPGVPERMQVNPSKQLIYSCEYSNEKEHDLLLEIADLVEFMIQSPISKDLVVYTKNTGFARIANKCATHPYETWGYFDKICEMHKQMGTSVRVEHV